MPNNQKLQIIQQVQGTQTSSKPTRNEPQRTSPELLRRCTSGAGESAWQEFVGRHERRLARILASLWVRQESTADPARVADLLQELYCRLIAGWSRPARRFRGASEAEAEAYLRRVARSVVLDARRDLGASKRGGGRVLSLSDERLARHQPVASEAGAEARLLRRERRQLFLRLCRAQLGRRVTAQSMRIVELAFVEGWSSREISSALPGNPNVATIDSVIHRLRRRFAAAGLTVPRRLRPARRSAPGAI